MATLCSLHRCILLLTISALETHIVFISTRQSPVPSPPSPQVVYETMPGWKSDISQVRQWSDLPQAARDYVQRIEDLIGIHVKWIGVGPGRDAIVVKPAKGKC